MGRILGGATAVLLLAACGGSGGGGGGGGGAAGMTATIDGQAFSADQLSRASVTTSQPGIYTLIGSTLISGTTAQSITLSFYNLGAAGTYLLGVGPTCFGAPPPWSSAPRPGRRRSTDTAARRSSRC